MVFVQPPAFPGQPNFMQAAAGAESVRGARVRNAMAQQQLELSAEAQMNRRKVRAARKQSENAGEIVGRLRANGDHEAADGFIRSQQKQHEAAIKAIESAGRWVTDESTYEQLRTNLLTRGVIEPEDMPANFDPKFFGLEAKRIRNKLSTLNRVVGVKNGIPQQEQITQDEFGNVLSRSPTFEATSDRREQRLLAESLRNRKKDGVTLDLPVAVSNSINRSVGTAIGGQFDIITGRFVFSDAAQRQQAAQVAEDAELLLKKGQATSVQQAVTQALRRSGVPVPSSEGAPNGFNPDDPLGILPPTP